MKKFLLMVSILMPMFLSAQKPLPKVYDVLIGTYTTGSSKGIYVYRFYTEKGKLEYLSQIDGVDNPSYLTVSSNNKFVYAVNELTKGEVSAFKFEANTGKLEFINKRSTLGADPCHLSVDKEQRNLIVANYSSGTLTVLPLAKDGSIEEALQTVHDDAHGPDTSRQKSAHAHMAVFSPDQKYVLYNDLGTDKINILKYRPTAKDNRVVPASPAYISTAPGAGPRHLTFSNDGKYAYLLQEMLSAITVYSYNNGKLKELQTITMLPAGFRGATGAAAIHISPDGRFLYASNRLDTNEIVVYAIDQQSGRLVFVQRQSTGGKNPRDFAIDPTGNYLLAANQGSDSIYIFKINKETGHITLVLNRKVEIGNPVCLKFTAAE